MLKLKCFNFKILKYLQPQKWISAKNPELAQVLKLKCLNIGFRVLAKIIFWYEYNKKNHLLQLLTILYETSN